MDNLAQQNIDILLIELKNAGVNVNDPVSKLMVVTLLHQVQKIKDEIEALPSRIIERLCSTFVPKNRVEAIPAISFVQPAIKAKRDLTPHTIVEGCCFSFKIDSKQSLSFYPLYKTLLLPFTKTYLMTPTGFRTAESYTKIPFGKKGHVWFGMEVSSEIDTLENVSFLIRGTDGVMPQRILVGTSLSDLMFSSADRMDSIPMMEPFDSQQMNAKNLSVAAHWQTALSQAGNDRLIYITDPMKDRDLFKCKAYPKSFQQSLESTDLDKFADNTLWLLFDFGNEYSVPDSIEIIPNVVPVVNVSINSVTLTQSSPIAKLTKNDGAYYFSLIETPLSLQKQGFDVNEEDFIIRDFDARSYHADNLAKEVRNLYNHFIEDYYAFVEYHGLKDGELIRSLRETVNKIGKSVLTNTEGLNRFDEGVYAMRNIKLVGQPSPVKVSYMTTMGRKGNLPQAGMILENKKDAALEKDVSIVLSACGGEDRATADQMYELLRYYTLTSDRLYTKMDVDAFLRLQLLKEFGKEEIKRISYDITIQGAEGSVKLQKGLYIDILFKDNKNYQKAISLSLERKLYQQIIDKSCISMPIIVSLHNSDLDVSLSKQ